MILIFKKKRNLEGMSKHKVELINNKNLIDSLSVSKNSIKNFFDELLRDKKGLNLL